MSRLALESMQPPVKQVAVLFPGHKAARVCPDHSLMLRMREAIPLLTLYSFKMWRGATLTFIWYRLLVLSFVHIYFQRLRRIPSTHFPKFANYLWHLWSLHVSNNWMQHRAHVQIFILVVRELYWPWNWHDYLYFTHGRWSSWNWSQYCRSSAQNAMAKLR